MGQGNAIHVYTLLIKCQTTRIFLFLFSANLLLLGLLLLLPVPSPFFLNSFSKANSQWVMDVIQDDTIK